MPATAASMGPDALRIRNEFLELPGLRLTIPQAARLMNVSAALAAQVLVDLEHEGFLEHSIMQSRAVYRRSSPDLS